MSERKFGPVHFIPGANGGRYPHSNSVYVEGAGVLIDAGADRERYLALRDGPGVNEIWLSHWHEDHITLLDLFENVPLRQMAIEAEPLSGMEARCIVYRKPREPRAFFEWGEGAIMGKHLERLVLSGAVACEGDRYRRVG